MKIKRIIEQLNSNKEIIKNLVQYVTQEQAVWRPSKNRWTVMEIINHLIDIEIIDFRYDFDLVLNHPEDSWPSFSIEKLRIEGKYNNREIKSSINKFLEEREKSIIWLSDLNNPDLNSLHSGQGFKGKRMKAGDVLVSWIAHDLFHIRHLTLLQWYILNEWEKPYSPRYSGFRISI